MLDKLRTYLESPDHPDDTFVRMDSIRFEKDDGLLELKVKNYHETETWSSWEIRARKLRDFCIVEPYYELSLFEENHVLAIQHTDTRQKLYFTGAPRSGLETTGKLLAAHREVVGDWIPFEKYFNTQCDLTDLLNGGSGLLADGPTFLIDVYARVIVEDGMKPNPFPPRPAKWWDGHVWIESDRPLAVLIIGSAYFVAEEFEEELISGKGTGNEPYV